MKYIVAVNIWWRSLAAALMMTAATLPCASDQGGSACFIEVNAGSLSVKIKKAALSDVLRIVGEQAGARVSIQGNLGDVQPQVFASVPLPDGIKRLVQNSNANLVVIYNPGITQDTYILLRFARTKEIAIIAHFLLHLPVLLHKHRRRY